MPSSTAKLLDSLVANGFRWDARPWGVMGCLNAPDNDITIKHISITSGNRTSLQFHRLKDELLILIEDYSEGYVELGEGDTTALHHLGTGRLVRIAPGMRHRVVGPMEYLEISTYDDNTDTVRVSDDYGRVT